MTTSQTIDTAAPSPEVPPPAAADHLTDRVKNGLVVVRRRLETAEQRITGVPAQLRESLDRLLRGARERIRTSLNLPSQAEIEALIARVEELDRKLAALSAQPAAAPAAEEPKAEAKVEGKGKKKNGK